MRIVISIAMVTGIVMLFTACTKESHTTESALLVDITDKQIVIPTAPEILNVYHLENEWNGAIFHFTTLSDVSQNKTSTATLEPSNEWLSNKPKRNKEIQGFKQQVSDILSDSIHIQTGKNYSSVYLPIARELELLSKSKSQRRILIVYSDLMENTESLSFYRKQDFEKLKTKPEQVQNYFEALTPINTLTGIEVYFIYQPTDPKSDERFRIISEFYKKQLLETKGATVTISANLTM